MSLWGQRGSRIAQALDHVETSSERWIRAAVGLKPFHEPLLAPSLGPSPGSEEALCTSNYSFYCIKTTLQRSEFHKRMVNVVENYTNYT